jgi:hypothetical protein
VVFTPEYPPLAEELMARAQYDMLIVLPKWNAAPHPTRPGWVQRVGARDEGAIDAILSEIAPDVRIRRSDSAGRPTLSFARTEAGPSPPAPMTAGLIETPQTLVGKDMEAVVVNDSGGVVLGRVYYDDAPIYILADPDFLNTAGIADANTARAGMAMLELVNYPGQPIAFDVTLNGFERTRSLIRLALEPPLLAATLCFAAAAGLMAWRSITHSAPKRHEERAIALGKRALADNSAALLRMARREHRMGWGYVQMIAAETADRIGVARGEGEEMLALFDRMGASLGVSRNFSDLAAEASAATDPVQMLAAARALHAWKEEMIRATR